MEQDIIALYQSVLIRTPSDEEIDFWLGWRETHTAAQMEAEFRGSPEGIKVQTVDLPVIALYQALLGRAPDAEGLAYWTEQLASGSRSFQDLINSFADSPEFEQKNPGLGGANPSPELIAELFYTNLLDRAPDAGGLAYWTERLASGDLSTDSFVASFVNTPEVQTKIGPAIRAYYADVQDGKIDDPANEGSLHDGGSDNGGEQPGPGGPGGPGEPGNTPPSVNPNLNLAFSEDASTTLFLKATDADGDALTYSVTSELPAGLQWDSDGSITFDSSYFRSLDPNDVLNIPITYEVSDGTATTIGTANITITGTSANQALFSDGSEPTDIARTQADAAANGIYWVRDRKEVGITLDEGRFTFHVDGDGSATTGYDRFQGAKIIDANYASEAEFRAESGYNIGHGGGASYNFYIDESWASDGRQQSSGVWIQLQNLTSNLATNGHFAEAVYLDADAVKALKASPSAPPNSIPLPDDFTQGFAFWNSDEGFYDYQQFGGSGEVRVEFTLGAESHDWTITGNGQTITSSSSTRTVGLTDHIESIIVNSQNFGHDESYKYDDFHLFEGTSPANIAPAATNTGTPQAEDIIGGHGSQVIYGGNGDDLLVAGERTVGGQPSLDTDSDILIGGNGRDTLAGNFGAPGATTIMFGGHVTARDENGRYAESHEGNTSSLIPDFASQWHPLKGEFANIYQPRDGQNILVMSDAQDSIEFFISATGATPFDNFAEFDGTYEVHRFNVEEDQIWFARVGGTDANKPQPTVDLGKSEFIFDEGSNSDGTLELYLTDQAGPATITIKLVGLQNYDAQGGVSQFLLGDGSPLG